MYGCNLINKLISHLTDETKAASLSDYPTGKEVMMRSSTEGAYLYGATDSLLTEEDNYLYPDLQMIPIVGG